VLLQEIGRGGCAIIYEAHDLRRGRIVAVKLVKSTARDTQANARLAREARASAALDHPNVCSLEDAGQLPDGRPYLVMERLHGETLTHRLRRSGTLSSYEAIDVALQLLSALDAAHRKGIVHRDVKPDNVFLIPRPDQTPFVKLLDFGMCRRVSPTNSDDMTLTRAGQVVGTPEYMSPEQVSGKRTFDARIDLYAVGVILYEVLSGQRAFPGKDAREVVISVLVRALPPLRSIRPDVPPALHDVVTRAMDRDPASRYSSAASFQRDLLDAKAQLDARYQRAQLARAEGWHDQRQEQRRAPQPAWLEPEWEEPTRQLMRQPRSA
jgi:serine/threonine-protein kinase